MTQNETCPTCGSPLATTGPAAGSCPRCLLGLGREDPELVYTSGRPTEPPPTVEELAPAFPDLEIEELLGTGGMGSVYRARQRKLDRRVALKILRSDVARLPEFAERFQREARALAALSHPGIVSVHDCGRAGEWYFLLMEHVEGANLRHLLRTGRLSPKEALELVGQICDALQYAHEHGVVHRDIKPENILVDTRGRAKIADFGLAKLHQPGRVDLTLTESAQSMGTLHYMAPEQVETPREVDHRADIYSLGVVFYELLTGELPLGRFRKPSEKVQLDVRIDEIVLRSLEKEPQRRYQAAGEVRTDVDALGRSAPPPPPAQERDRGAGEERSGGVAPARTPERDERTPGRRSKAPAWLKVTLAFGCLGFLGLGLLGVGLLLLTGTSTTPAPRSTSESEALFETVSPGGATVIAGAGTRQGSAALTRDAVPRLAPGFVRETGLDPSRAEDANVVLADLDRRYDAALRGALEQAEIRDDGVHVRLEGFPAERTALLGEARERLSEALGAAWWERFGDELALEERFLFGAGDVDVTLRAYGEPPARTYVVELQRGGRTEFDACGSELPAPLEDLWRLAHAPL